jgi:hypothetical protein
MNGVKSILIGILLGALVAGIGLAAVITMYILHCWYSDDSSQQFRIAFFHLL